MSCSGLLVAPGAIGPTAFAILAWGAIVLVIAAFGYVLWALFTE